MGLFDASSRSVVRDYGDIYREKADRLAEETRQHYTAGRLTDAEERARELIHFQAKVVGERHPEYASGLCMLAEVLSGQDELSDAETLIQRALEIRKKALGDRHPDYASGLDQMGRLMLRWEDFSAAEPLLVKALEIRKASLGVDNPEYAQSLAALAEVVFRREDHAEAERLLRESIEIQARAQGDNHPDVASALCRLSEVLDRKGQIEEAEVLLRRAVEILRLGHGDNHPDHMAALSSLAALLQRKGDLNAAEPIWRLLLDMIRLTRGVPLPDCSAIETQLGLLLQRRGDLKGAESLFREALESSKSSLGERHPDYAVSLTNLALLLQRAEDLQGAETHFRQALAVRKEVLGPRHPDYASSLINLAQLVQKRGDVTWARMLLKEAVEVRRTVLGEDHADYAQGLAAFADVHAQQGELTKAEALLRQALEIRRRVHGEQHTVYAANLSSLAGVLRRMGDLDAAEALLRQSLQIRKTTLGEEHPDYATNLGNIAWLLQRKGDREGADALLSQALQLRRRLLGEQHPDYRQSYERLNSLRAGGVVSSGASSAGVAPRIGQAGEISDSPRSHENQVEETFPSSDIDIPEATESFEAAAQQGSVPGERQSASECDPEEDCGTQVSLTYSELPIVARLFTCEGGDEGCASEEEYSNAYAPVDPENRELFDLVAHDLVTGREAQGRFEDGGRDDSPQGVVRPDPGEEEGTVAPDLLDADNNRRADDAGPPDDTEETGLVSPGTDRSVTQDEVTPDCSCHQTDFFEAPMIHATGESEGLISSEDHSTSSAVYLEEAEHAGSQSMSQSSSHLSQELAGMSDRFSEIGERLLAAARQLNSPGVLPPEELAESVGACRRDFESLRDRVLDLAGSLTVPCPRAEQLRSLQDLNGLLDHVAEAEIRQSKSEEQRRRSLSVLDRVLALSHTSMTEFAPLRECQDKARELRKGIAEGAWSQLPAEAERLAEGQHHFADLLSLIEDHDDLHDDHWATLHDNVGQSFGKALAAAAARSKLYLPDAHPDSH